MLDVVADLDDTHLCIRCNGTIIGLAAYVEHRKSHCPAKIDACQVAGRKQQKSLKLKDPKDLFTIKITDASFTEDDNDSFPSTASHKPAKPLDKSLDSFHFNYDLIGSPHPASSSAVVRTTIATPPSSSAVDFEPSATKPSDTLCYTYEDLGADFFFSSLQLQSSSKRIASHKTPDLPSNSREPNQCPWTTDGHKSTVEPGAGKKLTNIYNLQLSDDSELEEESYYNDNSENDTEEEYEDYDAPPSTHTGGKWKPEHRPQESSNLHRALRTSSPLPSAVQWKDRVSGSPDVYHHPSYLSPPRNCSGKWVPKMEYKPEVAYVTVQHSAAATPHDALGASAGGRRSEERSTYFWCNSCNRRLSSKIVYERHLKSTLHLTRTTLEAELSQSLHDLHPTVVEPTAATPRRTKRRSVYLNPNTYARASENSDSPPDNRQNRLSKGAVGSHKKRRNRRKTYTRCEVCNMRLSISYLGKHLISHFHYRRMHLNPEKSRAMALENLPRIIKLAPFQCQPCRFYTITEPLFIRHWQSAAHIETVKGCSKLWCSFCKFECPHHEMMSHLRGPIHQELVQSLNRCVPIVIREKVMLHCPNCLLEFRHNIQIRKHICWAPSKAPAEPMPTLDTASDSYQSIISCVECKATFRTSHALVRHQNVVHSTTKKYFCSICDLRFETQAEAFKHRNTASHKVRAKRRNNSANLQKSCRYCHAGFNDILELKQHLRDRHPEVRFVCPLCGAQFVMSQELSRHVRDKKCEPGTPTERPCPLKCDKCSYKTGSEAEMIFHGILHQCDDNSGVLPTKDLKLPCPMCDKQFRKASLLCHLRKHKNERIYKCQVCAKAYTRSYNLLDHMKSHEKSGKKERDDLPETSISTCTFENCSYEYSNERNYKKHYQSHFLDRQKFQCNQCEFKTGVERYLKRHQLIHVNTSKE